MVTLDLWPLWRLDSLSFKISTSQSGPLARATPQVLFLSSFSSLKDLSLPAGPYLALLIILLQHAVLYTSGFVHKPGKVLGTSSRLSIAMQKPCVFGSDVCQCASNSRNSLVQWDFFMTEEAKSANGAVWTCIGFCKESLWKHPPGRWNESLLVFFFFNPFVDFSVCTRSLQEVHCYGRQMSLRKTNDSYSGQLTTRALLQLTLSNV